MRSSWVALAAALPFVAGCNDVLGLSDFERVSCRATCPGDSGGDAAFDAGSVGSTDAAPFDGAVAATDGGWARWPMPNPDGGADAGWPNVVTYSAVDAGVVADRVSKLEWSTHAFPASFIDLAAGNCQSIGYRLPTRIELVSLLDFTRQGPFIDPIFTNVSSGEYWTASATGGRYWAVDFGSGEVTQSTSDKRNVLCVRSR